jgi:hypothetical protein
MAAINTPAKQRMGVPPSFAAQKYPGRTPVENAAIPE